MDTKSFAARIAWVLAVPTLALASAGAAQASGSIGTRLDTYCAARPAGTTIPQQSRPYRASGSSCALCHPAGGGNNANNLNAAGVATRSAAGAGYNPFCINAAPTGTPAVTAPAAGATVSAGSPVAFTGSGGTDPDGFPLTYNWTFNNGIAPATGASVTVTAPTTPGTLTATLEVRDANSAAIATRPSRSVTVSGAPQNQAPNGSITAPVSIVQGQAVTFTGSGTDPDGNTPLNYAWTFGTSGVAASTAQNPSVTFNTVGTYTVTLTVRDSLNLADSTPASVQVTVAAPPNQAPNGTITPPANVTQGVAATFQGSATDPEGNPVTYAWNFGANATPATSTAQNPSVTFSTAGARTVTLTVTDSLGLADPTPASVQVTVAAPPNQAPNGSITPPATVTQAAAATFQGSATDPDGDTVTYLWNFGANATPATSTAQNPSVTFSTTGLRTVTLTVTDSRGLADPTPASVSVNVATPPVTNVAPNGTITPPATIVQGQAVTFQGSATDANGDTVTYAWNFGANATPATSTAQNPSVTFSTAGARSVTLTVTDSQGLADPSPASVQVTVAAPNQAPNGTITAPASIVQNQAVTFQGSATDANGDPVTYAWNFGANATPATSTAQNPSVTFSTAGARTVTLTVTDSGGLADTSPASVQVNVAAPANQPPNGTITPPASIVQNQAVTFLGSATDTNGDTVTYAWNFGANATPATSTAQNPSVTFSTTGARTVSLTVIDSGGLADPTAATAQVTVVAAPPAPAACTDADRDGYFAEGGVCGPRDCNDNNAAINPGATEVCGDGIDNDCDGATDSTDKECNGTDCLGRFFAAPVVITSASWNSGDRELDVRGSQAQAGAAVTILNANSGALIGTAVAGSTGTWRLDRENVSPAPCRVRVEINGQSAERVVSGAPTTCSGGTPPPPSPANQAPNGTISSPAGNVSVAAGGTVNFQGSGTDPDSNTPLTYLWNFGGGATNSTAQNPGNVQFNTAGTFTVTFTVRDATLADPTPATRTVTVTRNQAPQGTIIRPTRNVTVERGHSVSFQGIGSDPDGNTPLSYSWNFGGGATNSTLQNPRVRFNTNGTFTVRFAVRDARGLADPTPATLTVTVVDDD